MPHLAPSTGAYGYSCSWPERADDGLHRAYKSHEDEVLISRQNELIIRNEFKIRDNTSNMFLVFYLKF